MTVNSWSTPNIHVRRAPEVKLFNSTVKVNSESYWHVTLLLCLLPSSLPSCPISAHSYLVCSTTLLHLSSTAHPAPPLEPYCPFSHPPPLKDQGGPGVPQQALSPAQLPEEAECLTVPKYKRDLVQKLKILRQELSQQQPQAGHCRIEVCREEIFEVKRTRGWHFHTLKHTQTTC